MIAALAPVRKLSPEDDVSAFDCGEESLNRFLKRHALAGQRAHGVQTYVGCRGRRIVGYYSLAVGSVEWNIAPERVKKGLARHPVPVMLLARLAVDRSEQGAGIGRGLLKDALARTLQAADIAGIRAILVHAKNDSVKRWYERLDFEPSPADPLQMFLLMKDLKRALGRE